MTLKYQSEIDKLTPCFIGYNEPKNRNAYRWVFADNTDYRNFIPPYKIDPIRKRKDFTGWALSLFESPLQAKTSLLHQLKSKPELYKKLGTHTASGILVQDDGLSEDRCNEFGHFNHFEYVHTDLATKFEIVEQIAGI